MFLKSHILCNDFDRTYFATVNSYLIYENTMLQNCDIKLVAISSPVIFSLLFFRIFRIFFNNSTIKCNRIISGYDLICLPK